MAKRIVDIIFSLVGLTVLCPVFLIIAMLISLSSKGPVFYFQTRIGKNKQPFKLFKFRTMFVAADKKGLLTVGMNDKRITAVGYYLRKYKIDELPQLFNVLIGEMSLVGPRPEVERYVQMYNTQQQKVLTIKPGITDLASLKYSNENELLGNSNNPEKLYIETIMPDKLSINLDYIEKQTLLLDFKIIFATVFKIALI